MSMYCTTPKPKKKHTTYKICVVHIRLEKYYSVNLTSRRAHPIPINAGTRTTAKQIMLTMITLWISTRLSKVLACLLLQPILSLAFSPCLIRSTASTGISLKTNDYYDDFRWRRNVNCFHNRDLDYLDQVRMSRSGSAWYSTSQNSKANLLLRRQPIVLLGQIVPTNEREESKIIVLRRGRSYSTWLYRLVRPIVRWYRVVAVSLLVMVSSFAIASSTGTAVTPAGTTTIRNQGSTTSSYPSPTPFTKVSNAVSNTLLIGATAAAGAALGRYFILTKEAEKELEILERDGATSRSCDSTNTKSPEVVVVPTLSTKELSLTLSIAPPIDFQDGRDTLANKTSDNSIAADVGTSHSIRPTTEEAVQQESNGDYQEPPAEVKDEKEDKPFQTFQWNNKRTASSAALSLQLIENDGSEVSKAKTMTTLSEREKLTTKKAASITSSRFPFSSKLRSAGTRSEGLVKPSTTNNAIAETRLAAKYAAMSPETRAYTILLDLGLIQEHQDPDDPMYDNTHDDAYCI